MIDKKYWHMVRTKQGLESKVIYNFNKQQINYYYPLIEPPRIAVNKNDHFYLQLFPSFIFVLVSKPELQQLIHVRGVIGFAYWLNEPAIISEQEIDAIKHFLLYHDEVKVVKSHVNIDRRITYTKRKLPICTVDGFRYQIINEVLLPSLGYILCGRLFESNINELEFQTLSGHAR